MGNLIFGTNITLDACCGHDAAESDDKVFRYWTLLMDEGAS